MFKIIYVYISDTDNIYTTMLQISLQSLRRHMPSIPVEIFCNDKTKEHLSATHPELLADENLALVAIPIPEKYTNVEASRYLKTNLRSFTTGDFIFLDCDTIICSDFSNATLDNSVGMVLDMHQLFSVNHASTREVKKNAQMLGMDFSNVEKYFNSGVMLVKDNEEAHRLFAKWFAYWEQTRKPGKHQDQLSLNAINIALDTIVEVDKSWNLQTAVLAVTVPHIGDYKVMHYFATAETHAPFLLNDPELLKQGVSHPTIQAVINHPYNAYKPVGVYTHDSFEWKFLNSVLFRVINWLRVYPRKAVAPTLKKIIRVFKKK